MSTKGLSRALVNCAECTRGKALKVPGTGSQEWEGPRTGLGVREGGWNHLSCPSSGSSDRRVAPLYGRSRATLAAARLVGSSGLLEVLAKSTRAVPGLWVSLAAALGVLCQSTPQRAAPLKKTKEVGDEKKGLPPRPPLP